MSSLSHKLHAQTPANYAFKCFWRRCRTKLRDTTSNFPQWTNSVNCLNIMCSLGGCRVCGQTNRECGLFQLPSFCLNSDRLTFLSVTWQADTHCAATTITRSETSNWIPRNAGERDLGSCMWAFAEVQVRGVFSFMSLGAQTASTSRDPDHVSPVHAFICLLTAAVRAVVLLQGCYVSEPAQSVNVLRVWGSAEELKGFLVGLRGAEPSQVAAWG